MKKYDDMNLDEYDPDYGEYEEGTYFICPREDCQAYDEAMVGNCNAMEPEYIPENGEDCTFYKSEIQQAADEANAALHKRGLKTLKINPKFRDLVPKMSTEEFKQLEDNILHDGRIREPIVYWNGYIVDGHHRYEIAQKHPEIRYDTVEKKFDSEDEACIWICKNQLGRRNLDKQDRDYLIGQQMKMEENLHGGDHCSEDYKKAKCQSGSLLDQDNDTAKRVAKENNVSPRTVARDKKYADAVDKAEEIVPGIKEKIRSGEVKAPKELMENIADAKPEDQGEAFLAVWEGNLEEAKNIVTLKKSRAAKIEEKGKVDSKPDSQIDEDGKSADALYALCEQLENVKCNMDARLEEDIDNFGKSQLITQSIQRNLFKVLEILEDIIGDAEQWDDKVRDIMSDENRYEIKDENGKEK